MATGFGILIVLVGSGLGSDGASGSLQKEPDPSSWIIQWIAEPLPEFWTESDVQDYYRTSRVTVARPKPGVSLEEWLAEWSRSEAVLSIEPNQKVRAAKTPNDPLLSNQGYLSQIHAEAAWDTETSARMVIAVVDTGVDSSHPDLADRLVSGVNLVDPNAPPDDDNGHGTNVAGILAAVADNDIGTSGLLWNARIMPVKALESDGNGDEDKLGEGIRYAVAHGAKIVVLSLGLNKYSAYMAKIVQEAEDQGVLLVAASGNEGNAVKYPGAYDTVLAVGGVREDNTAERLSNSGPELDLVAPWVVFTTSRGGGYDYKDGTSMAAPQVAAVAALAWSKHPGMTPSEIRNLLRQTAQDLGAPGWDKQYGYGLLRADRAVKEAPKRDIYEPNDRQASAMPIPSNKSIQAFADPGEEDWFYWDAPYDGVAQYRLSGADSSMELVHVPESTRVEQSIGSGALGSGESVEVEVTKGRYYVKVSTSAASSSAYTLHVDFKMYRDAFEDNNRQFKAYTLPARSQLLTGTFDQYQDQDWFSLPVDLPGTLKLKVSTDTARIDPVLTMIRKGAPEVTIDHNGDGQPEAYQLDVTPGLYYIKVANVSAYPYPVLGEYALDLHLATAYEDPYEPNDKSYQATVLRFGDNYYGVIDPDSDSDWYRIRLDGESLVHVELSPVQEPEGIQMQLLDGSLRSRNLPIKTQGAGRWTSEAELPAGTYYLKLYSGSGNRQQFYGLRVQADRLVEGFSDIYGHWAEPALTKLIRNGTISGYGGYDLYPDRPITRAEASSVLDRILTPDTAPPPGFEDVPADHWAYPAIARLTGAGIVSGYSRTTFAPDRYISRMEMMTVLANATGKQGYSRGEAPFPDVDASYWGAPILRQLKQEGWAEGYEDGSFRPERLASRAEFMSFTVKMLGL